MVAKNEPMFGKFVHPIKALITEESNQWEKDKSVLKDLYNVEKSNRYAETIMGQSDFSTFMAKGEGQGAENDSIEKTYDKTIEHIEFGKEFTITKKMADDAKIGIGANAKAKVKHFVRAYHMTQNELASLALANGTNPSMVYNKATVDLTTGDGHPLFYKSHPYANDKVKGKLKPQSNFFELTNYSATAEYLQRAMHTLAVTMRNFKDENGSNLGYIADTLIIPGNRAALESAAKVVCGTERVAGSPNNDINTQYGNWSLVVLKNWCTDDDRFMIMSSDANESLMGNMFFNRTPLDVRSGIDDHTRNMYWNGYCRFGVGFGSWKHILLAVTNETAGANAEDIEV
jgi:hypothetical protein